MNRNSNAVTAAIAILICAVFFTAGIVLALHKPLWNDEIYSQLASVERITFPHILAGGVSEGNNCPLFYSLQKTLCVITNYRLPYNWTSGDINDPYAQVFLRLNPILFMSLSVATIFYFFARMRGLLMGTYAASIFAASFITWSFIAEDRPYTQWVFLTVLQTICLFKVMQIKESGPPQRWWPITAVHILLSLTSVFGTVQAVLVALLIWVGRRLDDPRRLIGLALVPMCIGGFYLLHAPKYLFRVGDVFNLILINVSSDRLALLALYALAVACYAPWRRSWKNSGENYVWVFFAGLLVTALAMIMFYKAKKVPGMQGFELASRYFMNLAPVSALAVAFAVARALRELSHDIWLRLSVHIIVIGLIIVEALHTYAFMIGFYAW